MASDGTVLNANIKLDAISGAVIPAIDPYDIRSRRLCANGLVDDLFNDDYFSVVESSDSESQPALHLLVRWS